MNWGHCRNVTWGSSLPTELKDVLGHAFSCRRLAWCDSHWLSMKYSFLHVPNSPHRNATMVYGFDLVYMTDECCSISRHMAEIEVEQVQLCLGQIVHNT